MYEKKVKYAVLRSSVRRRRRGRERERERDKKEEKRGKKIFATLPRWIETSTDQQQFHHLSKALSTDSFVSLFYFLLLEREMICISICDEKATTQDASTSDVSSFIHHQLEWKTRQEWDTSTELFRQFDRSLLQTDVKTNENIDLLIDWELIIELPYEEDWSSIYSRILVIRSRISIHLLRLYQ